MHPDTFLNQVLPAEVIDYCSQQIKPLIMLCHESKIVVKYAN